MSKKLRVLWFVNTPSLASSKFGIKKDSSGSWIAAAELLIRKRADVDLAVAFLNLQGKTEKFIYRNRLYYSITEKNFYSRKYWFFRIIHRPNAYKMDDLMWVVKDFNPDIIHIYGTEGPFGLISKKTNVPVVVRVQGIWSIWTSVWARVLPPFRSFIYSGARANLTGYGAFNHYQLYKKLVKREARILRLNKYFIGQTDWDKKIIRSLNPSAKYFRNNSIFREGFFNNNWEQAKIGKIQIFSVLTPAIYKGFDAVLEISKILQERKIDFEWRIAGSTSNDYYLGIVEKNTKDCFENYNIKFIGVVGEKKIIEEMKRCSVYVHPSHIENDSNSIIEALLLGVPVIANRIGGVENFIKDNNTGLLVADYDYKNTADKIIDLSRNLKKMNFISRKARQRTRLLLNGRKSISQLINIYHEIIAIEKKRPN